MDNPRLDTLLFAIITTTTDCKMTEFEYRTERAYANSDLSELLNIATHRPAKVFPVKAGQFGTTFHTMVLEPELEIDWTKHHVTEHAKMLKMAQSFRETLGEQFLRNLFRFSQIETVKFWIDPLTGLRCKAKLDVLCEPTIQDRHIIDVKTTDCKSIQAWWSKFVEYGYDRQAAHYLDGVGLDYGFTFIVVQKVKPFETFMIHMSQSAERRGMIDVARKKNARLLRTAYEESLKPDGWRPSSWSRKEVSAQ